LLTKRRITAEQQNVTHGKCSEKLPHANRIIKRMLNFRFNWNLTLPYETAALHTAKCTVLLSTAVRTSNISSNYFRWWR